MSGFQPAISISEVISKIENKEYLLPSFQREFVWEPEQIEKLFDSLMRGYPISSMLFWKVKGENVGKWQFYEFLDHYRERRHIHNQKFDTSKNNDFFAILDGQQRLTAIYLALKSHYDIHIKHKPWDNNDKNFKICEFYMNLSYQKNEDSDFLYEFKWIDENITNKETIYCKNSQKWFRCKSIFDIAGKDSETLDEFIDDSQLEKNEKKTLRGLHKLIFNTPDDAKINYYLIESDEENIADIATDIFIRINSGGTNLSYSDILFSYTIANWNEAKDELNNLKGEINNLLNFNIKMDFILKSFLFLYHKTIKFQINSFDKNFITIFIKEKWNKIKESILIAFKLLKSFGLNEKNLSSNNAVLPIIYYIFHKNLDEKFLNNTAFEEDREFIKKYIFKTIILKPFGASSDNTLTELRKVFVKDFDMEIFFDNEKMNFPFQEIEKVLYKNKDFDNEDFFNEIMEFQYGKPEIFAILSLLNPDLDLKRNFNIDHLHPQKNCKEKGIDEKKWNSLPNLQLLYASENKSKNDTSLEEWVTKSYAESDRRARFLEINLIPTDVDLNLDKFDEFYEKRKKLLIEKLKKIL